MGTPIAGVVPVEQVIVTQTKRIISGTVGSAASSALIDRYDMNPYMAMGIGIGISDITYEGINYIGNMDYAKMASYFDFLSPEDGAVFWSGNKFEAAKHAKK